MATMKTSRVYRIGSRVVLTTGTGPNRAATVLVSSTLDAVIEMDFGRPGSSLPVWSWELMPLPAAPDSGRLAWWPRPCPPAPRGRIRKAWGGRRR
jgi:hypothetical protein